MTAWNDIVSQITTGFEGTSKQPYLVPPESPLGKQIAVHLVRIQAPYTPTTREIQHPYSSTSHTVPHCWKTQTAPGT